MKKNKLKSINFNSVDVVKRGANQRADIVFCKSDNTPIETESHILKKAFDYLKGLFSEPETIEKSDITQEYDGYATQLLKSFDSIIENDALSADDKTEMMQKSIQQFATFMSEAAPLWSNSKSVAKSVDLSTMIAKAEYPDNREERKESDNMAESYLTPEEEETLKSLQAKKFKGKVNPENEETPDGWIDDETKKGEKPDVKKSDIPEFIMSAIQKSDEFIKAQELKEMKEIAKKYEVLGEKADELGQHLYDLKKSDSSMYDASIAMLDRQVEAINKSGLFVEIGKSGANATSGGDAVDKIENIAKSYIEKEGLDYHSAMVKAWEAHPELAEEYERSEF